ncbi:MAG: oligosaccharide flippase family protein [Candidatus Krumholzibacteriota bacterium]|nr:oligosaccharide flippase family protein [Candidatus Krumholzibacteriota bacterium]
MTRRTSILIVCRVANYAVLLLSPIFLVRIFDVEAYGQYREFVLYAMLFSQILLFGVNPNLIYFIPKHPGRERESITHTALFTLTTSTVGVAAILLGRDLIIDRTSLDFIAPLALYTFFFLNLDFLEYYWLGRKRSDYVLYYTTTRTLLRMAAIIVTAWTTRSVTAVIWALTLAEGVKWLFLFFYFRGFFTASLDRSLLREQLGFILPLGSASSITYLNNHLAKLFISITLGPEKLAVYTIGNYQIPIINIVRASVMDALFPEMTQANERDRLRLWQRANVIFCFLVFPVFVVFFWYASPFIETLFKKEYLAAVPLFRIYLVMLVINCFEMGSPLRTINRNIFFVLGSVFFLVVNLALILSLYRLIGFAGPAIAFIAGNLVNVGYLGHKIMRCYGVSIRGLFMWGKIARIAAATIAAIPVLLAGSFAGLHPVPRAVLFSLAYLAVYYLVVRFMRIDEVVFVSDKIFRRVTRR